jgi:hypothetical protein
MRQRQQTRQDATYRSRKSVQTTGAGSYVQLDVFIPALGKSARITRRVSAPNKPKIEPAQMDVIAALAHVAEHPEITLSRRDVLRFILVESSKRSEEIQTLLKLDEIGQTRSTLNTVQNKLQQTQRLTSAAVTSAQDALRLHLQAPTLGSADFLDAVNKRRTILDLAEISELAADTRIDAGLAEKVKGSAFNKESSLRDLKAMASSAANISDLGKVGAATIVADFEKLEADPDLFQALQRRSFIEKGLELVDGPSCPLCDKEWEDEADLREHLRGKLAKSKAAEKIQQSLLNAGAEIAECSINVTSLLATVERHAQAVEESEFAKQITAWRSDLEALKGKVASFEGLAELKGRMATGWVAVPSQFPERLVALIKKVESKPDQTATVDAQTFLTTAQVRLDDYRTTRKRNKAAEAALKAGKAIYETYCEVMEGKLNALCARP